MSPDPITFPLLQAIVDVDTAGRHGWTPTDLARACFDGGARFLQIRAKHLAGGPFLELCHAIVRLGRSYAADVLVNDRIDLAQLSGAAGVHVGQDDLPPCAARRLLAPDAIVGYSTHSGAQVEAARAEPVSYIAVGPVFGSTTKETGYSAIGLTMVAEAVRVGGGRPVVAIGGITLENAQSVLAAGATTVAVISDLMTGGSPSKRVAAYLRLLR